MTKHTLIISFLLFLSSNIFSQNAVIAVDKLNVFYLGLTNPISIAVEGIPSNQLKISIDNGHISNTPSFYGCYTVIPDTSGTANICIEWGNQKAIKSFRVKPIPDPYISYDCKRFNGIRVELLNMDFDAKCTVLGYTCAVIPTIGETKVVHVKGHISPELSEAIGKMKTSYRLSISNVYVRCPGDKVPRLINTGIKCSDYSKF